MKDEPRRRRGQAREAERRAGRAARPLLHITLGAVAVLGVMAVGAVAFMAWGIYDVSALQQHTAPVYRALNAALERSIRQRAEHLEVPPLDDPRTIQQGLAIYHRACVQCHGAPGVPRDDVGKGLTPIPANLVHTARNWGAAEIYWTVRNGIKMSGMPAWRFQYSDEQIWSIVAFVETLPALAPAEYRAMAARLDPAPADRPAGSETPLPPPDPERGRTALQAYGCAACHRVPDVVGPRVDVGPTLAGMAERRYIAGVLVNNFDNMVRWIREPQDISPLTAMPDLDVSRRDARDIAAYLATLD